MGKFKDWKMVVGAVYDEPVKSWITKDNYTNQFLEDWNVLIEDLVEYCITVNDNAYLGVVSIMELNDAILSLNKKIIYKECVKIIKQFEELENQS